MPKYGAVRAAGAFRIDVQPIKIPSWKVEQVRPYIANWLRHVGAMGNRYFRKTTATWSSPKPRFKVGDPVTGQKISYDRQGNMSVFIGTKNEKYYRVDKGTEEHEIMASGARSSTPGRSKYVKTFDPDGNPTGTKLAGSIQTETPPELNWRGVGALRV